MWKIGIAAISLSLALTGTALAQEPPERGAGQCKVRPVQSLVGRQASSAVRARAKRLSGAEVVRVLRPGQIVTMEFRGDRLNLHVDRRGRITRVACS